jgi:hypothetical protein
MLFSKELRLKNLVVFLLNSELIMLLSRRGEINLSLRVDSRKEIYCQKISSNSLFPAEERNIQFGSVLSLCLIRKKLPLFSL